MITCFNQIRLLNLDFESYKLLPQFSFSFLKRERAGVTEYIKATPKMQLGTLVDNILTGGYVDTNSQYYQAARNIAYAIQKDFSWLIPNLNPQVSYTGQLLFNGFVLPVKGRPDFELPKKLIIDLKVCNSTDYEGVIRFMDYKSQQFNYAKLAGVSKSYLMVYCKPKKSTIIKEILLPGTNHFWEEKIIKFGTYAATA